MRIAGSCLLLAVATAGLAPGSQDLRGLLYGNPDIERFSARPGVRVSVQYGSDQRICQAIVEPPQQLLHTDEEELPLLSPDAVTEILGSDLADSRARSTAEQDPEVQRLQRVLNR